MEKPLTPTKGQPVLDNALRCIQLGLSPDDAGTLHHFILHAADFFKISLSDFLGRKRTNSLAFPRMATMAAARALDLGTLVEIGKAFRRDHGTVIWACKRCAEDERLIERMSRLLTSWQIKPTTYQN